MGRQMAKRLAAAYKLYIHDPAPATADYARSIGAQVCSSAIELAPRCTVIIMSLPGPAQIETVIFGPGGLYDNLTSSHVIIDTSTVDPGTSRSAGERVSKKECAYLDCPILGRPSAVGKWTLPAGGDEKILDYVRPVLLTFAANAVHVGDQGAGNALKLLNQLMFSTINAISGEVLAICKHVGIDKEVFYRTVAESSAATVSGLFREAGKSIIDGSYAQPNFTVDLLLKDAKLALQMAKDSGAPSLVAGGVQLFNELAVAGGLGSQDSSSLYKIFSRNFTKETQQL
jgi:3-hydroxyisobutyrate dehydrogenase-like beta-hydroxyacid dehydrogenase